MIKNSNTVIFGFVITAFILRLLLEQFHLDWDYKMWYLTFFATISTYFGLYAQRQNSDEQFDFLMDVKGAAQGGALFALGTGIFTYIFYSFIHPHFLEIYVGDRRNEILEGLTTNHATEETASLAIANFNEMANMIYTPMNWSVITVASLTFLSIFYAITFSLITKFFPKFVNK